MNWSRKNPSSSGGLVPTNPLNLAIGVGNNIATQLDVGVVIDNFGLAAMIKMINNLQGVSLLSAPSVTTQNGLKANIDIVREFPYPTSFEKPKLSNNSDLAYSSGLDINGNPNVNLPPRSGHTANSPGVCDPGCRRQPGS